MEVGRGGVPSYVGSPTRLSRRTRRAGAGGAIVAVYRKSFEACVRTRKGTPSGLNARPLSPCPPGLHRGHPRPTKPPVARQARPVRPCPTHPPHPAPVPQVAHCASPPARPAYALLTQLPARAACVTKPRAPRAAARRRVPDAVWSRGPAEAETGRDEDPPPAARARVHHARMRGCCLRPSPPVHTTPPRPSWMELAA